MSGAENPSAENVNIAHRLDKGFYLNRCQCNTRITVSGGAVSEARAVAPPSSDKHGATPLGDAYAPLGAGAS
ncbi:unnamed protein product [Pieris brassicae]|uniref:Uncharacterized protein n=1 Tax=Pieris brassicae TaxID=7116 RepID=A0A9P0XEE2_PIEBR|nr:unnamed protein product [Pieris brassicae]